MIIASELLVCVIVPRNCVVVLLVAASVAALARQPYSLFSLCDSPCFMLLRCDVLSTPAVVRSAPLRMFSWVFRHCVGTVIVLLCDVLSPPLSWCVLHPHARCVGIRTLCVTVSCCCCAM
jgi:hypothetical protein